MRDRQLGTTRRVSVSSAEGQANDASATPRPSPPTAYVAFIVASDLVANDTNGSWDIFVRDRQLGTTTRVSISSAEGQANGDSDDPSISADGRYVAFDVLRQRPRRQRHERDLDVFVRDRQQGTTRRVSISSAEGQANGASSFSPSISADGRYVAFESDASDLVANDTNGTADVFVRDRQQGTTRRVSVSSAEGQATGDSSGCPSISADGRYVAFQSDASDLVANDTNGAQDVFVRDRQLGTTRRVSISSARARRTATAAAPRPSRPTAYVAFTVRASDLVANDTNGTADVFVRGPLH